MLEKLSSMVARITEFSSFNVLAIALTIIFVSYPLFFLIYRRGLKTCINGKTIEIKGPNGEIQKGDANSLMYVMNDACHQIEQKKKERIDGIIPELSERFEFVSSYSCIELKIESLLHEFRRRNGFDRLDTDKEFHDYAERVRDRLDRGLSKEVRKVSSCSIVAPEIDKDAILPIAQAFTVQVIETCIEEYESKKTMYEHYMPLFATLGDKIRVEFCRSKIEKHENRVNTLTEMLKRVLY